MRYILTLIIALLVCPASAQQATPPLDCWIIGVGGQSNAVGQVTGGPTAPTSNASRLFVYTQGGQWWRLFEPMHSHASAYGGAKYGALSSNPTLNGIGLLFGQKLADLIPDVNICLVPIAVSGTGMLEHTPSTSTSTIYGAGRALINEAKARGTLKAMLFVQGEGDTQVISQANAWAGKFSNWVTTVRADHGADVVVAFAQLGSNPQRVDYPYWDIVKAQQATVDMPGVIMINADDLPKSSDNVHYTAEANVLLAERFANVIATAQSSSCQ